MSEYFYLNNDLILDLRFDTNSENYINSSTDSDTNSLKEEAKLQGKYYSYLDIIEILAT